MEEREEERKKSRPLLCFVLLPSICPNREKTENQACRPKGELPAAPSLVWLLRTPSSSLACLPGATTGDSLAVRTTAATFSAHVGGSCCETPGGALCGKAIHMIASVPRSRSEQVSFQTEAPARRGGRREPSASQYTKAQTFICRLDIRHGDCFRVFTSGPHCVVWRGKVSVR